MKHYYKPQRKGEGMTKELKPEFGENLVTDVDIDAVWGNANFGDQKRRDVVDEAVFKIAAGYWTGHTAMTICHELGLIKKPETHKLRLTKKGQQYMWDRYAWLTRKTPTPDDAVRALEWYESKHGKEPMPLWVDDAIKQALLNKPAENVGDAKSALDAFNAVLPSCVDAYTPQQVNIIRSALVNLIEVKND